MICPRCDGQGEVYKAKIKSTDIEIYICDECEPNRKINHRLFKPIGR